MQIVASRAYQKCTRCVMDTSALDIIFDQEGICNYCTEFIKKNNHLFEDLEKKKESLINFVKKVKDDGRNNKYDCIVGISGGVDSSWTLVKAKELGLRPLAVHMDNGWNSELAQNNIANLVQKLDIDLYTHVINWNEYRELMQAFFDADVIDVELLYDNAMLAVNYQQAKKYNVKYIISGSNTATEGMRMPSAWNWFKYDKKNIIGIARKNGIKKLTTFPAIGVIQYIYNTFIKKIVWVRFLDYLNYDKFLAMDTLKENYNFKPYLYKHNESIFTRFYQGYILPKKFKVDKRKLHYATLVISGQISREAACVELEKSIHYNSKEEMENDISYFLKKMKWSKDQLNRYLVRPELSHYLYPNEKILYDFLKKLYKMISNS
jgi:N-acetyl sugar amidotransferase